LLEADVFTAIPWGIILLFGGGFALADGFRASGLTAHLAGQFQSVAHVPPWVVLLIVCLVINFLTELTSNTATANMFLPVLAAWAVGQGIEPQYVMIPATISASMAFMLPVATPPNAIVFGGGYLEVRDMARTGLMLNLLSVLLATAAGHWLLPAVMSFPRP
jgi:sodium-dependent dicarboxylate transporter 2/3/5